MTVPAPPPFRESPESFGRHGSLAGILTRPPDEGPEPTGMPVILLGAGILHKVGPSRAVVELARRLAEAGHPALRFDLSGIGDSPRAPGETSLMGTAVQDIQDAIGLMEERCGATDGVALVGFCSGADNALFVAGDDPRVSHVVLFDPTVHRTRGYQRRRRLRRLLSPRSWWNVLSGRSLALHLRSRRPDASERPPGYYGLLTASPEDTDRRVAALVDRDARLLYVLSRGCHDYCNAPEQVRESLPAGYSAEHIEVLWAPQLDHLLTTRDQRVELTRGILAFLSERRPGSGGARRDVAGVGVES